MSSTIPEPHFSDCTKDTCTVEDSVYGYYPSAVFTYIFIVLFFLSAAAHAFQGIKARSWSFMSVLTIGCLLEAVGYIGRLLLRNDPFDMSYLSIQLICITVGPAFLAAGVYLTLKHLIIVYGAQFSRLAPKWYTWIFISADITSILIQAIGAALAASADNPEPGNTTMMVGLGFQVFTLAIFGIMAIDVWVHIRKHKGEFNESAKGMRESRRFKLMIGSIIAAYIAIQIRCIYRIIEMAGGWANSIMQDEPSFIVLESVMIAFFVVVLNVGHPGFMFLQAKKVGVKDNEGSEMMEA
ncbi:RTA1-domain-containing protein [Cadophora sp. DSE1049]|nr:RTA1-domain-containing protein [Cadophora sp. DSE1049]